MYIRNDNLFNEVKQSIDLISVMRDNGVKFNRDNKCCCFAHNEKTPSMSIKNGRYKCFGCGCGGDIFDFIQTQYGLDRLNAAKYLIDTYNLPIVTSVKESDPVKQKQLREAAEKRKREQAEAEQAAQYSEYGHRRILNYLHWLREQEQTELVSNHIQWCDRQINRLIFDKYLIDFDIDTRLTQMYRQHGAAAILEKLPQDYFTGLIMAAAIGFR